MSENESYPRDELLLYVSGAMPADQARTLEQRMLEDGDFSSAIEAAEFSLLEDFAAGVLSQGDRRQVSAWIERSSGRRLHVRIARQLHRRAQTRKFTFPSVLSAFPARLRIPLSVVLLGVLALCALIPLKRKMTQRMPASVLDRTYHAPVLPAPVVLAHQDTILLVAERLRGTDISRKPAAFLVHTDDPVRLHVLLPASGSRSSYSVTIHSGDGNRTRPIQFANLKPSGSGDSHFVEMLLPPRSLSTGSQEVQLRSLQTMYTVRFTLSIAPPPAK